jgi:hypothetical protein
VEGDTVTLTYQWRADGADIDGAIGATFVPTAAEAHKLISCTVTADDGHSGTANATTAWVSMVNTAPTFTGTPSISGVAKKNQVLSLIGTETDDDDGDTVTLSYQWQADGANIGGATTGTYVVAAADKGKTLACTLTADDGNGGVTVTTTAGVMVQSFPWILLQPVLAAPGNASGGGNQ